MSKDLVTKWFNKISPTEQNLPLLVLSGMAYSPSQTLDEVMRGTPIGAQLQALIEAGKFGTASEDATALAKARLQAKLQSKPQDKPLFATLPTSGIGVKLFTPAQLLQEINSGTAVGRQWINNEIAFMKTLTMVR